MDAFIESNMTFGPFPDDHIFRIEQSKLLTRCDGVKTVEFIWRKTAYDMRFVEEKSSSPCKFLLLFLSQGAFGLEVDYLIALS